MISNVIHAKEAEFNELIQKEELVLMNFFAIWCGPCKMPASEVEKLADEFEGKVKILKADVDQEQALAIRYGVQSIPTLIVFKNGVQTEKRLSYQPYPKLKEMLNRQENRVLNPDDVLSHISLLLVFLEGLLSFLSPRVLPLLPVYMGYLAGQDQEQPYSQRRTSLLTISFAIGIFTAILLANISVCVLSSFFKDHMVYLVRIGGILTVLLGLHQLGTWKFKSLERTWKLPFQKRGNVDAVIAFLVGFTFSFAWTPCIGPALSSILLLVLSSGSLQVSTFLMIVYAPGFTIPFLMLGLSTGKVLHRTSNHKNIMSIAVKLGAVILIAIGLTMFTGKMNTISPYMSASDKTIAKKDTDTATPEQEEETADTPDIQTSAEQLDFVSTDQNGKQVPLGDYRGKVIFLNFWTTWCPPYQRELPHIQELYEKYRSSGEVAVSTVVNLGGQGKSAEGTRAFLDEHAYSMPVLFDDGSMYYYFQITSTPTTFTIDRNGKSLGYTKGQLTPDMTEDMIQQTLSGKKQGTGDIYGRGYIG